MAIKDPSNQLCDLLGIDYVSSRLHFLLWIGLAPHNPHLLSIQKGQNDQEFTDHLVETIKTFPSIAANIKYFAKYSLLPESEFSWISDSKRQLAWIEKFVLQSTNSLQFGISSINHLTPIPKHLTGISRVMAILDYTGATLTDVQRMDRIHVVKNAWNMQKQFEKNFDWMNDSDGDQKRQLFSKLMGSQGVSNFASVHSAYDHTEFLINLEGIFISNTEKSMFGKLARNRWNQIKRRENEKNTKKQCNFILPVAIDAKLTKLAAKYELSRVDVIEILIRHEAEHESSIKSWLQRLPKNNPLQ